MSESSPDGYFSYPKMRDPGNPLDPPAEYLALQAQHPIARVVLPSGRSTWLVTGHELARSILDDRNVSVDRTHPNYPFPVPNPEAVVAQLARWTQILLGDDPPLHTARRRMLITEFTVRQSQALRPRIQKIVDEQIDLLLAVGPPADLVKHVSLSVPSRVVCELLGIPYEDHDFFQTRTQMQLELDVPVVDQAKAVDELLAYFEQLISEKERSPGDDLLSRLIVNNRTAHAFDHDALVALGVLLLVGGHETTSNVISLGTAALLNDPKQLAEIKMDPSLVPSAVEEFLRFFSTATATNRVATTDIEIGGQTIRRGEGMIVMLSTVARDPRVFPSPGTLDIRRNARNHLAFSHGIHQCMGQNIARVELEIVFDALFTRLPELRLAVPFEELSFKFRALSFGMHELPVAW